MLYTRQISLVNILHRFSLNSSLPRAVQTSRKKKKVHNGETKTTNEKKKGKEKKKKIVSLLMQLEKT